MSFIRQTSGERRIQLSGLGTYFGTSSGGLFKFRRHGRITRPTQPAVITQLKNGGWQVELLGDKAGEGKVYPTLQAIEEDLKPKSSRLRKVRVSVD